MKQPYVLVVDDHADSLEMLCEYLRFRGVECISASGGAEAVRIALRTPPAVILMDMAMPQMDGWEATRLLRADPRTKDTTIFAVTGHAFNHLREQCIDAGCDDVITKPFDIEQLCNTVILAMHKAKSALRA